MREGHQRRDPLVDAMMEKLRPIKLDESFSICRVPQNIRNVDPSAYEPQAISIGPYHRGNANLHDMEDHKWRYMHNLLQRKPDNDITETLQQCIEVVKQSEVRARRCYKVPFDTCSDDFIMMLVLDGCFILELILGEKGEDDPLLVIPWMGSLILRDLFKFENQLPFFILEELFSIFVAPESPDFIPLKELTCVYLYIGYLKIENPFREEVACHLKSISEQEVYHLLHLLHKLLQPTAKATDTSTNKPSQYCLAMKPIFKKVNHLMSHILPNTKDTDHALSGSPSNSSSIKSIYKRIMQYLMSPVAKADKMMIPCIVELVDVGIKVRRKPEAMSILDVTFKDGILHIPPLIIHDATSSEFRNLTAFEQCCPYTSRYFTIYHKFLDCLINTAKDVAILQSCSIIENMLGSEEEVAQLINQIGKDLTLNPRDHYLEQVFTEVNRYCESKWHKHRATCMREYFSTPWSMLSLLAAVALLFMTLIQVIYAVLSYTKQ